MKNRNVGGPSYREDMEIRSNADPTACAPWDDPAFVAAYWCAAASTVRAGDEVEDEPFDEATDDPTDDPTGAPDPFDEVRSVDVVVRGARRLQAEQDRLFLSILTDAEARPDPWVGPDPTAEADYAPPEGLTVGAVRRRRRDIAVRAAAADVGARVQLTENGVRNRAHRARILVTRCPRVWKAYLSGDVSEQNAATAATFADSLPADAAAWAVFDAAVADPATRTAPGRFRLRARAARERAHPETVDQRHARSAADRSVSIEGDLDGMGTVFAAVPATAAAAIGRRLDADARHLHAQPGETRTLAQLRADVFIDLLTATPTDGSKTTAVVHLTIPALSLLGHADEPATLDGYGPIDLETARRLAGQATSWVRVLTHPVTGTVLDVDRRTYKVPKALRRWLGVHHPTCIFPGCTRPAHECDMDHIRRWTDGGTTSATNLGPECRSDHPVKDESLWSLARSPDSGILTWTTPSGHVVDVDPPPF